MRCVRVSADFSAVDMRCVRVNADFSLYLFYFIVNIHFYTSVNMYTMRTIINKYVL